MAEASDKEKFVEEQKRQLVADIRQIRAQLDADLHELRSRLDTHYLAEKAVVYMAQKAGSAVGTSLGFLRKFKKKSA